MDLRDHRRGGTYYRRARIFHRRGRAERQNGRSRLFQNDTLRLPPVCDQGKQKALFHPPRIHYFRSFDTGLHAVSTHILRADARDERLRAHHGARDNFRRRRDGFLRKTHRQTGILQIAFPVTRNARARIHTSVRVPGNDQSRGDHDEDTRLHRLASYDERIPHGHGGIRRENTQRKYQLCESTVPLVLN